MSLMEIIDVITDALQREKCSDANRLGVAATMALARHMGGRMFYLPAAKTLRSALRDKRLYNDYCTGVPVPELAKKFSLTEIWVYSIIRKHRALNKKKSQGELFSS